MLLKKNLMLANCAPQLLNAKVAGIIHTQHALHVTVEQKQLTMHKMQDAAVCCCVQLHTWVGQSSHSTQCWRASGCVNVSCVHYILHAQNSW